MASQTTIRVAVHGAAGRVGQEVLRAVQDADGMAVSVAIDTAIPEQTPVGVSHYDSVTDALRAQPSDVIVDFSNAAASLSMIPAAVALGARPVIGSTGFTRKQIEFIGSIISQHKSSGVLAPNFSIGAVLLTKLAQIAAPYFDYADVFEEHHETKVDAPSGTALAIVQAIHYGHPERFQHNEPERQPLAATRGGEYEGISVHSSRLPGRMAHHQVTFGAPGQTLTLRHDTINRECYMPGVLLAIRMVGGLEGLTLGLDPLIEL